MNEKHSRENNVILSEDREEKSTNHNIGRNNGRVGRYMCNETFFVVNEVVFSILSSVSAVVIVV